MANVRPAYRNATVGRPWRRHRSRHIAAATACCYCGGPFVRDGACNHPTHQQLTGCPTHPWYPTIEHPHALILGGAPRSDDNTLVAHFRCNSKRGSAAKAAARRVQVPKPKPAPLAW